MANVAGVNAPDPTQDGRNYGPTAYLVDFGYQVQLDDVSGLGGGSFSRTDPKALARLIRAHCRSYRPRHLRLGGHRVTQFRPGNNATCWAYPGTGGDYVFCSNDFGGPSRQTIGTMIASMRPVTQLRTPTPIQ